MADAPEIPRGTETVVVTGASGYIAAHIVQKLLEAGYTVRGTVRDPANAAKTKFLLDIAENANASDRLQLYRADLLDEGSFDEVMQGADYVLHTASPFFTKGVRDPQAQLVDPAVKGTANVLSAVSKVPSIKRVVLTSSTAAVHGNNDDSDGIFTEADWNRSSTLEGSPYPLSKRMAEEKAWEMAKAQDAYELVVINPALVIGPLLAPLVGTSVSIFKDMLEGQMRIGAPEIIMGVVDVRDVARAHIIAMKSPNAKGRYIMAPESLSLLQMGQMLSERYPQYPLPTSNLPKFLCYLILPLLAGFSWSYIKHNIGIVPRASVEKIKTELGFQFHPIKDALNDMAESLIQHGIVRSRPSQHK